MVEHSLEKPNYKLTYKSESRYDNDWQRASYLLQAAHDDQAREIASSFIQDHNEKAQTNWNLLILKPLRLERVDYVMGEIEEATPIPLSGDALSRLRDGVPIELFELS